MKIAYLIALVCFSACIADENTEAKNSTSDYVQPTVKEVDSIKPQVSIYEPQALVTLTNVHDLNPRIYVNLRYSSLNNFLNQDLYGDFDRAFLQEEVALMLANAQELLTFINPNLHLLVWDATRPRSVQWKMWYALDMPLEQKVRYVSNPRNGSIHNFGCAVDLTLCHSNWTLLDMGTDFDHFGKAASTRNAAALLADSTLTMQQFENRKLLQKVMRQAGFTTITSEWWHFNAMSREAAQAKYAIVE
jgi:D-alanyl-D-alanine dipeptidase